MWCAWRFLFFFCFSFILSCSLSPYFITWHYHFRFIVFLDYKIRICVLIFFLLSKYTQYICMILYVLRSWLGFSVFGFIFLLYILFRLQNIFTIMIVICPRELLLLTDCFIRMWRDSRLTDRYASCFVYVSLIFLVYSNFKVTLMTFLFFSSFFVFLFLNFIAAGTIYTFDYNRMRIEIVRWLIFHVCCWLEWRARASHGAPIGIPCATAGFLHSILHCRMDNLSSFWSLWQDVENCI